MPLPTERTEPSKSLADYTILIYGREKIGKTTLFSSFPDTMFLATEPGTKGLPIYEYNADDGGCRTWDIVRRAVRELEQEDAFQTVVIDTTDRAYDLCLDWVCDQMGIPYPGETPSGKEDYGKSWRAVRTEFTDVVHRILQTGRTLGFTSHAKESTVRRRGGEQYSRITPSMGSQARGTVEALVDVFLFADYMRDVDGDVRRVLVCQGDENLWAGFRAPARFPQFLPMEKEDGFAALEAGFKGEHPGIPPGELVTSKLTWEATKNLVNRAKANEVQRAKKAKGRSKRRRK